MEMQRLGNIRRVAIEDEMRSAYIDYAMSVIVARALPDVRRPEAGASANPLHHARDGPALDVGLSEECRGGR